MASCNGTNGLKAKATWCVLLEAKNVKNHVQFMQKWRAVQSKSSVWTCDRNVSCSCLLLSGIQFFKVIVIVMASCNGTNGVKAKATWCVRWTFLDIRWSLQRSWVPLELNIEHSIELKKLAVVVHVRQTTQSLVISGWCFAEDAKKFTKI